MRRTIGIIFILIIMTIISGCGMNNAVKESYKPDSEQKITSIEPDLREKGDAEENVDHTTESSEVDYPIEQINVDWKIISYTTTDSDGYTYEVTYKLSPWVLLSNTEYISTAWGEISNNRTLPSFNDWGLKLQGGSYSRSSIPNHGLNSWCSWKMTDMYYCVGQISVKNKTQGWDITQENKRSIDIRLNISENSIDGKQGCSAIGETFFSNGSSMTANGACVYTTMTKNTWGPVPFVIMAPENITPNFPNGQYYNNMKESKLISGNWASLCDSSHFEDIKIGIVGVDGVYVSPENN